jgi:hypothetical protein
MKLMEHENHKEVNVPNIFDFMRIVENECKKEIVHYAEEKDENGYLWMILFVHKTEGNWCFKFNCRIIRATLLLAESNWSRIKFVKSEHH